MQIESLEWCYVNEDGDEIAYYTYIHGLSWKN